MNPEEAQKQATEIIERLNQAGQQFRGQGKEGDGMDPETARKLAAANRRHTAMAPVSVTGKKLNRQKILISALVISIIITGAYFLTRGETSGIVLPAGTKLIQVPNEPPRLSEPLLPKN